MVLLNTGIFWSPIGQRQHHVVNILVISGTVLNMFQEIYFLLFKSVCHFLNYFERNLCSQRLHYLENRNIITIQMSRFLFECVLKCTLFLWWKKTDFSLLHDMLICCSRKQLCLLIFFWKPWCFFLCSRFSSEIWIKVNILNTQFFLL